jgi:hypothetical protein
MRSAFVTMVLGAVALVSARAEGQSFEGRETSKDGAVVVSYKVVDGYKITLSIDTPRKKGAYRRSWKGDVVLIRAEFPDLNGDSRPDVILEFADEDGYSPTVLINRDDLSFVDALRLKQPFVVETQPDIVNGKAIPRGKLELKPTGAGRPPDLVFHDVAIGDERYRSATFRLDPAKLTYRLVAKGKSLGKQRGEGDEL